ncbi:hypothetical protein CEK62_20115 (plasmid) [Alcanivorax sp. N3-2A]|nr:hypothetical protein CEK62_01935 [Alcanivorax sp. N3-2A]ASK36675.1 hypothetical protein CEK62_20115 [Alcanivorax sp. N3-2A]|tara:strand:- start:16381 stop:16893 length:513 start_codon:yes stop_codon:yes gene_type:complete
MRFAFWKKQEPIKLQTMSWNLMVAAIDPEKCWEIASLFRDTDMPSNVRTCEMSFFMGSVVRDIIRKTVPQAHLRQCITSAEAAYFKTFDDQSDEPLPPEMVKVYGASTLGHISRVALATYSEGNDTPFITLATLVHRLKGDPRMKYEITPLIEQRAAFLRGAFTKAISKA